MTVINITAADSGGVIAGGMPVRVDLVTGQSRGGHHDGGEVAKPYKANLNNAGVGSFTVVRNDELTPAGSKYKVTLGESIWWIQVNGDGPYDLGAEAIQTDDIVPATVQVGPGVPAGGTTGQIPAKASGADYDTEWIDPPSGSVGTVAGVAPSSGNVPKAGLVTALAGTGSGDLAAGTAPADAVAALPETDDTLSVLTDVTTVPGKVLNRRRIKAITAGAAVANTTTKTTMIASGAPSFAANELDTAKALLIRGGGVCLNNSGSTATITVRIETQTNTVWAFDLPLPAAAGNRNWYVDGILRFSTLFGLNGFGPARCTVSSAGGGVGFDTGAATRTPALATYDFAAAMTFDITAQHSAAHANLTCTLSGLYVAVVEAV